jgi:hypothetical protein
LAGGYAAASLGGGHRRPCCTIRQQIRKPKLRLRKKFVEELGDSSVRSWPPPTLSEGTERGGIELGEVRIDHKSRLQSLPT